MPHALTRFAASFVLGLTVTTVGAAQETPSADSPPTTGLSRSEVRDKQLDVTLEARDIERILTRLKRASDLSKERIAEAAELAEEVSNQLERGASSDARAGAQQTAKMFEEIARQLEALLAEETPQQLAAARELAAKLTRMERQLAQQLEGAMNPQQSGRGKGDPRSQTPPKSVSRQGSGGKSEQDDPQTPRNGSGKSTAQDPAAEQQGRGKEQAKGDGQKPNDEAQSGGGSSKPDDDKPQDGESGGASGEKPKTEEQSKAGGNGPGRDDQDGRPESRGGGGERDPMTDDERRADLAARADELAERGETLLDILQTIAQSTEPGDREAVAQVNALLKETDLPSVIEAMREAAGQIESRDLLEARLAALDVADRMEIMTRRLDAAYRALVAPQAEELRELEQQLLTLREKLGDLQTPAQVAALHRQLRELLDRAAELGISEAVREELLKQMEEAGVGVNGPLNRSAWGIVDGRYVAPQGYLVALIHLQEDVQSRIQTLLLGDIVSAADEAAPPRFQTLVERYYQVLSREQGEKQPSP